MLFHRFKGEVGIHLRVDGALESRDRPLPKGQIARRRKEILETFGESLVAARHECKEDKSDTENKSAETYHDYSEW